VRIITLFLLFKVNRFWISDLTMAENGSKTRITAFYITGLLFSLGGVMLAGLLVCKHVFPDLCTGSYGCNINGTDGCSNLGKSDYSKLFGIPVALPGFFYYIFMTLLYIELFRSRNSSSRFGILPVIAGLAAFGIVIDGFLGYINFFILGTPCMLCAYSYIMTLGLSIGAFGAYFIDRPEAVSKQ
jgi:uncharacterized membrane protein